MKKTKNISTDLSDNELELKEVIIEDEPEEVDFSEVEKLKKPEKELSEEIKSFRLKNKEFQATNDHDTYIIVCFSTKDDKNIFLENINFANEHTLIDGYQLAKSLSLQPQKPSVKLAKPLKNK